MVPARFALSVALCLAASGCKTAPEPTQPVTTPEPPPEPPAPAPAADPETWVGAIELPGGTKLNFVARLAPPAEASGAWTGTLDLPQQGVKEFPLKDIAVAADSVDFTFAPPGAPEEQWAIFGFEREGGAAEAKGSLSQRGQSFPATMRRLAAGEEPKLTPNRPQEPKGPFAYQVRDVSFKSAATDAVQLAGTFTIPNGTGPFPAVALLTGSGAQDRDEALMGHKPFLVLADHLTRSGVAVLRFDDRGVGGSQGELNKATQADLAGDARGAIDWLLQQQEVDRRRLGLIGHSEGAMIAAKAAALDKRIGFIVMLAGPGVSGRELLPMQLGAIGKASGAAQADIDAQIAAQKDLLAALAAGKPREELSALLRKLVTLQSPGIPDEQAEAVTQGSLVALDNAWFRDLLKADPRADLRKLRKVPVLAIGGALDLQVPVEQNLPEIEKALKKGGNRDHRVKTLPGLNHLFQHAKTGLPGEYADIEETFAQEALDEVTRWVLDSPAR